MSIQYAILGILSCQPYTGYDLKKIIQDSPFMHWSGNNNQIYKSLVELLEDGFVTSEVHHQESSPSKKVYTITREGLAELKDWACSAPELPELKKTFLVQLAWTDQLSQEELETLLSQYEYELKMQIVLHQERKRRGAFWPGRSPREELIWESIDQNILSSFESELEWVKKLRMQLVGNKEETDTMHYTVNENHGKKYIEYASKEHPIQSEQDGLDLIATCSEQDTNLILLHSEALSDEFFQLRTGLAGAVLQKLSNYRVKAALVLTDSQKAKGKFKDFLAESNRGNSFRVFQEKAEAVDWLLK